MTTPEEFARRRQALERSYDVLRQPPEEPSQAWAEEARRTLIDLADSDISRVVKLRVLIDTLRRQPPEVRQRLDDQARLVLQHTLPTTASELPEDILVNQAKDRLDAVVGAPGEAYLEEAHWRQLTEESGQLFGFALQERTFEGGCNDEALAWKRTPGGGRVESRLLIAQFWTDQPPSAFIDYVNPVNWPKCSSFWEDMDPVGDVARAPNGNYTGVFNEVVKIDNQTLRVPLEVGFRINPELSRVWARFNIDPAEYRRREEAGDPVPVDVDTGTVSAESVPGGPAATRVRATKYLHAPAGSAAARFAELACDFGWSEMMITMAFGCSPRGPSEVASAAAAARAPAPPGPAVAAAAPPAAVPADVAVGRFVERVVGDCQDGINATSEHVQSMIRRFTGPSWDLGWINDLLGIGVVTAERYGRVLSHVRGLADNLGREEDQRGSR